ncbi:hypothetical protein BK709_19015 [Bacillus thuringiensis serovar shandongiensis]|uniref:helix-turn-helix domain-containing protein n=1 Tax=Bacillus cereus group TaxID=86661 RepID=UPI00053939A4|nr:helix-turn-helix domain-containing protein [Bacillus toyonensis]MEC2392627.1 helix-turn-helix domain-containing protein [Bacillus toyonensis]OTX40557.1 transcriptional regulator [Bacillus thuringiensis serovar malayensis]OUB04976.1 hypothetical protein BK709_19015 [Bacillus thuringiensis serovar shandongiensis]
MNKEANKRTLERFNHYRDSNGVTLRFLAKQLGLHHNNLSKWRADKIQFSLETLRRIDAWLDSKER